MKKNSLDSLKAPGLGFQKHLPAWLALLILALLYETLPDVYYLGRHGIMISIIVLLSLLMFTTHFLDRYKSHHFLSIGTIGITTFYIIISVLRLISSTLAGQIDPKRLLTASIILWISNILLFSLWYWNLDEGGPIQRQFKKTTFSHSFLFPQMQFEMTRSAEEEHPFKNWSPQFIDYVFLAYNTSTAFSPTDTPILSRWAKCATLTQSMISLTLVVMLVARAINILGYQ